MWAAESLVAFLKGAQQDGTLDKISTRFHEINLDQVTQTLENLKTDIEREDFLKYAVPSFYLLIR